MSSFKIDGTSFEYELPLESVRSLTIKSLPRSYDVNFIETVRAIKRYIKQCPLPLILIDSTVKYSYFEESFFQGIPTFSLDALESNKNISSVLDIANFLNKNNANKSAILFVIGGGMIQDVGAFACAIYKRGLPWVYIPTTLLSQSDSCIGGKTALNFKDTKNMLALFSAPRQVLICPAFLQTLPELDIFSGLGEIFRLCITAGEDALRTFIDNLYGFLQLDDQASIINLVLLSLTIKKVIIEHDEFELNIRRALNYGHSFGHALEALSNYTIPHGIAVTIGILVENEMADTLPETDRNDLVRFAKQIIPKAIYEIYQKTSLLGIMSFLKNDKKTEGAILKLPAMTSIGTMIFMDFDLNKNGEENIDGALEVLKDKYESLIG